MHTLFLSFCLLTAGFLFAQTGTPAVIRYRDCDVISEQQALDTICGVPVPVTKTVVRGTQRVQTFCNFGRPADNRYENVSVIAEISIVKDSAGVLKRALYDEIRNQIRKSETYAASNGFTATVVSLCAVFRIGGLAVAAMPPFNSSEGNSGTWYIDGYLYKVKLTEDNRIGRLNVFLRENFSLTYNGEQLDTDNADNSIESLRTLVQE